MTRKPLFWIIFILLGIAGTLLTLQYFPKAFPIVNVNITMNRQQAMAEAKKLAEQHGWGPAPFQQAATFSLDSEVQHFVELEAGGVEKFNALLRGDRYAPYKWIVRHFKESEKTETIIKFTPAGQFYGFTQQLPENQPGASLSADSALILAKAGAGNWGIDLTPYALVEKSQEKRIGGRTDHAFTFERSDETLGDGLYRLELNVSGDQFSALRHFVKIPEAFQRRYQEMRSSNDTLASVALFVVAVLYGIIGIGFGLFYLLKERWLKWRAALFWGCFIGLLQSLALVNQWPLLWMSYDTALSYNSFFMQQILQLVLIFFGETLLLTLTFMAAEGLTRKAFPDQTQLWQNWRPAAASSKPVLGHTVSGYLGVSLFFAFDIALYFFATHVLGWWTPSSSLFDPDVLATYQPWLSSVAISLHAGFWEECLFRAIPIAGAVLLGRKYGGTTGWLVAAFLLQAVIFGAGHANYPTQPAYARVVELILPAIGFGLIYLYLGLLPGIILHFAYDVVWFALPLFVSSTPGIWVQQVLVIIFTLLPLWIVFYARLKQKKWSDAVPQTLKNSSFAPQPLKDRGEMETVVQAPAKVKKSGNLWFAAAGILGALLWIQFADMSNLAPKLPVTRATAEQIAEDVIKAHDVALSSKWKLLSRVDEPLNQNDRFIWQQEGDSVYRSLMGSYLGGPYWLVRCAMFEGDVVARAEEYRLELQAPERVKFSHILPEATPGDSLQADDARLIAERALSERFGLDAAQLKSVSSTPSKLKNRVDWEFVWADTARHPLQSGECRIIINLAGSEVAHVQQTVHVPEEWSRSDREKNMMIKILDLVMGAMPSLFLVVALVFSIISWSRKQFAVQLFLKIALLLGVVTLLGLFNSWPSVRSNFVTAAPWQHQALLATIFSILAAIVISASIGMVNGFIKATQKNLILSREIKPVAALGAGFLIAGIMSLFQSLAPSLAPPWADYSDLGNRWPILSLALGSITNLFVTGTALLLIFTVAERLTRSWTRKKYLAAVIIILAGLTLTSVSNSGTILHWLINGLVKGVLFWLAYVFILRHRLSLAPWVYVPVLLLHCVKGFMHAPYPGAQTGYLLCFLVVPVVALVWESWLRREA